MWVGSLPGTAPTVAYDDDVIFLGTWTFTMLLEISKNNASAVQNQCLLDSLLTNVANSYSMKRVGHEHGRTKDKRKKRNWDLHDFQFLEKNPSRPAYSCTRCARCARCTLRLNFCLALATKIEGEVQNPTRTLQFESSIQVQGNQFWGRHVSLRKNTHVFAENLKTVPGSIYVSYRVIWNVPACCSKTSDLDFLQAAVMLQWFFRFLLDKMKIVHRCRKLWN